MAESTGAAPNPAGATKQKAMRDGKGQSSKDLPPMRLLTAEEVSKKFQLKVLASQELEASIEDDQEEEV